MRKKRNTEKLEEENRKATRKGSRKKKKVGMSRA
jgi:hypothetical protein